MEEIADRSGEPMERITVGEEPTVCVHCGARTELIEQYLDGSRTEQCVGCDQLYSVTDEIEVVDESDFIYEKEEYDSRPTIGELLRERLKQKQLERDLARSEPNSEYGDKFGSF